MLLRKKIKNSFTKLRQVYTVLIATELLAGNGRCTLKNSNDAENACCAKKIKYKKYIKKKEIVRSYIKPSTGIY